MIIMGLHLLHIELLADSQTPCLFIDTQPIVSALNSDTMSVRYYGRFADFPALRHSESVMRGNDFPQYSDSVCFGYEQRHEQELICSE